MAVDGLDLSVPAGGVHGFLGPNGSGKTTTIKMLLGLTRPTGGEMRLFGLQVPAQLPQVIDRVGAIVEEPRFTPTFSGRKNLSLLARSIGVPRSHRRRGAPAGRPGRPRQGAVRHATRSA